MIDLGDDGNNPPMTNDILKEMKDIKEIKELNRFVNPLKSKYTVKFLTPKYTAPEITICEPRHGWAQDIWSLGCILIELFIDYTKYDEGSIEILLTRIFKGENIVPRIPKDLEQNIAMIVAKCFYIEPYLRVDTLSMIEKFNKYFKKKSL